MIVNLDYNLDSCKYPKDIFLSDSNNLIGTYRHPLNLNILELKSLQQAIQPILTYYKKWLKLYEKYQDDKLTIKELNQKASKILQELKLV